MFAYCLNNPVNFIDVTGHEPEEVLKEDENQPELVPDNDVLAPANTGQAPQPASGGTGTSTGKGFFSFSALKNFLGSPGTGNHWHHYVEQCQITKSGFSPEMINNTSNIVSIDATTHQKISGFYSSKPDFTGGLTVRDWLAGQPYAYQFDFGTRELARIIAGGK